MEKSRSISKKVFAYAFIAFFNMVTFWCFSEVLLAESASVESVEVFVPQSQNLSNEEALFAKAAQFGSVRVIVGFDIEFQPEGTLASTSEVQNQRDAIDLAQDVLLNSLVSFDVRQVKRFDYIPYMALEVDADALDALWHNPSIISIQEDVPVPPTLAQSVPLINADAVWGAGFDGAGITIAILDTGVDKTHEFLDGGKVVSEACYSSNDSYYGSTTVCPNGLEEQEGTGAGVNCSTSIDGCDHGTHVAGIAAGTGGAGGLEGVAKGANVIAIQVFSRFTGSTCTSIGYSSPCALTFTSDQIKGLERVYALRGTYTIAAVNMSLGGGRYASNCDTDSRKAIIDNLRSEGIATVIASGNSGYKDALGAPACISTAVSVGATSKSDVVASFSNSAAFLHLLAPGVSINSSVPGNSYSSFNGTSMAAPHVAGAFALLKHADPQSTVDNILASLQAKGVGITDVNGITKPRIDVLAASIKPEITNPVPGSTLTDSTVTFQWSSNGYPATGWWMYVGSSPGAYDLHNSGSLGAGKTSHTVSGLSTDGSTIHVRLFYLFGGSWQFVDFQYTAVTWNIAITDPTPGSTLTSTSVTFQWTAGGAPVTQWWLYVGTAPGQNDIHDSGSLGTSTSTTVSGLPYNGSQVYVRLYFKISGAWKNKNYQFTALDSSPRITDPAPGSTLADTTVTFQWTADVAPVTEWWLYVGTAPGGSNLHDSGSLGTSLSTTVSGLPFNGSTIYVRLFFRISGSWQKRDFQYTAVTRNPRITDPTPGSTLTSTTVTFQWTADGVSVTKWWLYVGTAPGLNDIHDSGSLGTSTSTTISGCPADGRQLHVRLYFMVSGAWKNKDYQYTALDSSPRITDPAPGSTLTNNTVTFQWTADGASVTEWWLYVGTAPGGSNLHDSGSLGTSLSTIVSGLPFDGSTIYVRLFFRISGSWQNRDFQYTAVTWNPGITDPAPGSTLTGTTVTFQWTAGGAPITDWWLYVGSALGGNNLHDSGSLGTSLSTTVSGLPSDGSAIYVRLWYKTSGPYAYTDYQYWAIGSYHRLYNDLICPIDSSTPLVTLTACGKTITASYGNWSSCTSNQSGYCDSFLVIYSGICAGTYYYGAIEFQEGCVYSYDVYADFSYLYMDIYQQCPGNCSTPTPFSESPSVSDPVDAGELIDTIKIPFESDFSSTE